MDSGWIFVVLGLLGAILTSTSWLPQIAKAWRTRSLTDISWATLGIFGAGTLCWFFYGLFREDWIIIGANAFISVCISTLLFMKFTFRKN